MLNNLTIPQDALEDHYTEVLATSEWVDELHQLLQKTSGQAEPHFRPYIQDTTEDYSVTCNASVTIRTPANAEDSKHLNAEPDGSANCVEKRKEKSEARDNSKFMEKLTPQRLFWLSSKDMQLYITHHQGQRAAPSAMDFIQASLDLLVDLGINASAYDAAQEQMGDMATALCVLIIDRNRFHPETPIHNPGGVLRAMTKRHAAGLLNIVGSLIGITERDKQ